MPQFLERYPEIQLDIHLTDNFVDIIRDGFDLAIRIGELEDSSLVARKLSPDTRLIVAAPSYLEKNGTPKTLKDLEDHNCLSAGAQDLWSLQGPGGTHQIRVKGNLRSNSAEFVREALLNGLGIGLRGTWEIGEEIRTGKLEIVMPQYRGSSNMAIFAVYPSRDFMPAKVDVFLEFLAGHFSSDPYWERGLDLRGAKPSGRTGSKANSRQSVKKAAAAM